MMFTFFSINNFSRTFLFAFLLFFLFLLLFNGPLFGGGWQAAKEFEDVDTSGEIILARLSRAMAELSALKAQNEELRGLIQNYIPLESLQLTLDAAAAAKQKKSQQGEDQLKSPRDGGSSSAAAGAASVAAAATPDAQFELARRKLKRDIGELWNFIKHNSNHSTALFAQELKSSLLFDLGTMSKRDEAWRRRELAALSTLVQAKIAELQNPPDCRSARKLVCNLNKGCGFGCQIHHLTYCMIVAMATRRTLVLNSKNWRYVNTANRRTMMGGSGNGSGGAGGPIRSLWDTAFRPLSNSCLEDSGSPRGNWAHAGDEGEREEMQVLDLPIIDSLRRRPAYLPLAVPVELADRLTALHGSPFVWFTGQLLRFLMRPSPEVGRYLEVRRAQLFAGSPSSAAGSPIVGVHVRRTDKINTEAAFHPLSEYMAQVEEYYDQLDLLNQRQQNRNVAPVKRLVYLATDDATVWKKEIQSYEQMGYKFIGDYEISNTASIGRRYSFDSLKNIILDVWLLSETDYLVCTFSSQVCRLAYELMQSRSPPVDRSLDYCSLDDIYYFGGQSGHNQVAVLAHQPKMTNEISLKVGDVLGIAGNHWNGMSKGVNKETKEDGLYPGFKTVEKIETAAFELFQEEH